MSWLLSNPIPLAPRTSGPVTVTASGDSVLAPSESPDGADALLCGSTAATARIVPTPGDCLKP